MFIHGLTCSDVIFGLCFDCLACACAVARSTVTLSLAESPPSLLWIPMGVAIVMVIGMVTSAKEPSQEKLLLVTSFMSWLALDIARGSQPWGEAL